ncbi:MAG: NADH-ubiquinone oxidoreductase subunit E family protein, partial [Campylobacter sp.]|nr:NADH-ubiquinone oxidoreductase subunit E family protein [Campylobacter sp.]
MKRVDLRHLQDKFLSALGETIRDANGGEVIIFLFETGDFSGIENSINLAYNLNCEIINSLKFNQTDWT